jgi:hypothetical protein
LVARLAQRIASFPAEAVRSAKRVLNELTLPSADAIRARRPAVPPPGRLRRRPGPHGRPVRLQTRGPLELDLGDRIGAL